MDDDKEKEQEQEVKTDEPVRLKGKYVSVVGKRKTAVARIRLYKNGNGAAVINGLKLNEYFAADLAAIVSQPLKLAKQLREFNFSVLVKGGGKKAQAEAVRHGIVRALISVNKEFRPGFKAKGWVTRDARKKERKKPGLKRARRAPQWSKR